jgi:RNA exonuclease 4
MQDVSRLLEGKILVGHALHNDLDVLMMNHHRTMIRDTACYPPYMRVCMKLLYSSTTTSIYI